MLHRVEGFKETLLPCGGFLAGEAHGEEGEAVAGETIGGVLSGNIANYLY